MALELSLQAIRGHKKKLLSTSTPKIMGNCIQIKRESKSDCCKHQLLKTQSPSSQEKVRFVLFNEEDFLNVKLARQVSSGSKMLHRDSLPSYQIMSHLVQSGGSSKVNLKLGGREGERPCIKIIVTREQFSELLCRNGEKGIMRKLSNNGEKGAYWCAKKAKVCGRRGKWSPSLASIPEFS